MQSFAKVRVVRLIFLVLFSLVLIAPTQTLGQVCGDVLVPVDGLVTVPDITYLFAYLFMNGSAPNNDYDANIDTLGDLTNNDVVKIVHHIFHDPAEPIFCKNVAANVPFPSSADTVEFRELIVPPGNTTWDVEVWVKATGSYYGLSLPFLFDCPTSPMTIQSVTFHAGGSANYQAGAGTGVLGMFEIITPYLSGETHIATITFTINSWPDNQLIQIAPTSYYPPSNTLVLSRITGAVFGYTPVVVEVIPEFTPIETDPADVVSIVTADLDLDTYTDVIYAGDTEVGLFVAWGQDADPPIATGVKFLDVTDATVDVFHINADILPDLVAVTATNIYTLINNGDRTFTTYTTANSPGSYRSRDEVATSFGTAPQFAIGFINDDQYPDLVVAPNKWFAGDGTGGFSSRPALGFSFESVAISDFNADGFDDLAVVTPSAIAIYTHDAVFPATYTQSATLPLGLAGYDLSSITTNVDVNRDGAVDVVAVVAENTGVDDESIVTVALGDNAGGLTSADVLTITGTAAQVSLSDVDRDFYQDVVVANASDGNLEIYHNDGSSQFGEVAVIEIATGSDLMFALTTADLDRDGQPDFISGSAAGENLIIALNNELDQPVLEDELFVTGYDNIDVSLTNPTGFVISRTLQTVAGSDYFRLQAGYGDALDVRLYDYNLQYGEYEIVGTSRPGIPDGEPIVLGIGIDGTKQRFAALNYRRPISRKTGEAVDPFVFYFSMEEVSSIRPENGFPTPDSRPTFDWSGYPVAGPYTFQMDRYHDFSSGDLIYDVSGLTEPSFHPPTHLETDSLYYWRFLAPGDYTSRTFAAYIIKCLPECCTGRVGDANGEGTDEPTIGDISVLIDAKFITGTCDGLLPCLLEADVNRSGGCYLSCNDITIGDISTLIDYLFVRGPTIVILPDCL